MAVQGAGLIPSLTRAGQSDQVAQMPTNPDAPVYVRVLIDGLVAFTIASVLVLMFGTPISTGTAGAAAGVLAISTALAVGIERLLEGFWTLMDQLATQTSWPFASEAKQLEAFTNQFGNYVRPGLDSARTLLATLQQEGPAQYDQLKQHVEDLKTVVDAVASAQDPGTLPAALTAAQAASRSIALRVENPDVRAQMQLAAAGVTAVAQSAELAGNEPWPPGPELVRRRSAWQPQSLD